MKKPQTQIDLLFQKKTGKTKHKIMNLAACRDCLTFVAVGVILGRNVVFFGRESDRLWQIKLGKKDNGTKPNRAKLLPLGRVRSGKESLPAHDSHK